MKNLLNIQYIVRNNADIYKIIYVEIFLFKKPQKETPYVINILFIPLVMVHAQIAEWVMDCE